MIARNGRIIHQEQVGWQDLEKKIPLTTDTVFRLYSLTKPIIAAAIMTLYEEARFKLTDPVAKFLPAFGTVRVMMGRTLTDTRDVALERPITIFDLLTHTSGLTYNFLEDSPVSELYRQAGLMTAANQTLEGMISELSRLPLAYQPGSRWHYSLSYDVLAHLIEVISGQPLQDFLQKRLFSPLGMNTTGFSVKSADRGQLATMYGHPDIAATTFSAIIKSWQNGCSGVIDVENTYPSTNSPDFARGGHGLFSTIGDYMRFTQMLLNRGELDGVRILAPKIIDFMHMNHLPASLLPYEIGGVRRTGYGFGLGSRVLMNVAESVLPGSEGEYGWSGAAKTYYWVDPQEKLIGILMAQYMVDFTLPERDFQLLTYQALMD